jgi:cardiolipin synthase
MLKASFPIFASFVLLAGCAQQATLRGPLPAQTPVHSAEFRRAMGALIVPGFASGNRVQTLSNGAEIFPAMLAAIRGARKSINFETFVFERGEIPAEFAQALGERARAGVSVNVILDAFGASKSTPYRQELRDAGVHLELYHRLFWFDAHRFNYRTHRKLLIVDGRIGFIGGVGIADAWNGRASNPEEWRDLHYRVEGPVVAQMQGAFNDDWLDTHHEVLQGSAYYPPLSPAGSLPAKVFFSSPRPGRSAVELMYHLAIAGSQRSLRIETPYFLPDRALLDALCAAAQRGVRVQIIMPGEHIDQKAVRRASRKRWPKLLQAGVELYEFQPTMIHTKLLVADDLFTSVGSANFDPRSLRINNEANLSVLDAGFAAEQTRIFQRDLQRSQRVENDGGHPLKRPHEIPVQTAQTPVESQL